MDEIINQITKDVNVMTREEFEQLPERGWCEEIGPFDSLVIMPNEEIHESGYRCMGFVAVLHSVAICKIGGGSDIVHVEGIGGMGQWGITKFYRNGGKMPHLVDSWSIDCLKVSGYLRLFPQQPFYMRAGTATSSFEVFSVPPAEFDGADHSGTGPSPGQ